MIAVELGRLSRPARPEAEEDSGGGRFGALLIDLNPRLVQRLPQLRLTLLQERRQIAGALEQVAYSHLLQHLEMKPARNGESSSKQRVKRVSVFRQH